MSYPAPSCPFPYEPAPHPPAPLASAPYASARDTSAWHGSAQYGLAQYGLAQYGSARGASAQCESEHRHGGGSGRVLLRLGEGLGWTAVCLVVFLVICLVLRRADAQQATSPPDNLQWSMGAKDYANTRYSELTAITTTNVRNLSLAWTFEMGVQRSTGGAPIVVNDTMFVVTPEPHVLYALDLKQQGKVKWRYTPPPVRVELGVAEHDRLTRGAVYDTGRVFFNTRDGQTVAVQAQTGKELWRTRVAEIQRGETLTMSPLVVRKKVLVGNSGGEQGVRGWIKALDADTGEVIWTACSTGPDSDVKIGAAFRPFYRDDRGQDLGVRSWGPGQWQTGGGNVWGEISYDPELNLIYHGTGNAGPWSADLRPGDNKWTCGVFAREPETGEARWYYQWSPHDLFDHDGVNENILATLRLSWQKRKVLLHVDRNGYVYVLDRTTGEVLSATPFVRVTATRGVDLKTGRLQYNKDKIPQIGKVVRDIAPAAPGAKDSQPAAFSPRTEWLYIPHQTQAMDSEGTAAHYIAGTPSVGNMIRVYADPVDAAEGSRGAFTAWDPVKQRQMWRIREKSPVVSGALVTAGDVVFYGTLEGKFKAVHARTGEVLWQHATASPLQSQPISYRGPDGKQYVAILGGGGSAESLASISPDSPDATSPERLLNPMKDAPPSTAKGVLYVFTLP